MHVVGLFRRPMRRLPRNGQRALDAERARLREEARGGASWRRVEAELAQCTQVLTTIQAERNAILVVLTPGLQREAAEVGAKLREAEASQHKTAIHHEGQMDERLAASIRAASEAGEVRG